MTGANLFKCAALAAAFLMAGGSGAAWADPHKNESGHGRGWSKHESRSGNCKYERKAGPGGFKEEYKCEGPGRARFAGGPPPWAPAHGYRRDRYRDYGLPAPPLNLDLGHCNREVIGQILGGGIGAAAGSQIGDGSGRIAAVAAGTIIGVLVGGEIGRSMDRADALCVDHVLEEAPDGETVTWAGDRQTYAVTPVETVRTADGRYCREYTARSTVGGKQVQTYGTACRQPDGSWQIMN